MLREIHVSVALMLLAACSAEPSPRASDTKEIVALSAGSHACALTRPGLVSCWGGKAYGEDGRNGNILVPGLVEHFGAAFEIDVGGDHTCAVGPLGIVSCWGNGLWGTLGDGTFEDSQTPVQVSGLKEVVDIATGFGNVYAVDSHGRVFGWGMGGAVLGPGIKMAKGEPIAIAGLSDAVGLCAGDGNACARLADGTVKCWGKNLDGGAIPGSDGAVSEPKEIPGLTGASGCCIESENGCAWFPDGHVLCWGENQYGEVGIGNQQPAHLPVPVTLPPVAEVVCGLNHVCALTRDRGVWCWGNAAGVGDGTWGEGPYRPIRSTPVRVHIEDVTSLAAGYEFTCAAVHGDELWCWGSNEDGQLGDDRKEELSLVPVRANW